MDEGDRKQTNVGSLKKGNYVGVFSGFRLIGLGKVKNEKRILIKTDRII